MWTWRACSGSAKMRTRCFERPKPQRFSSSPSGENRAAFAITSCSATSSVQSWPLRTRFGPARYIFERENGMRTTAASHKRSTNSYRLVSPHGPSTSCMTTSPILLRWEPAEHRNLVGKASRGRLAREAGRMLDYAFALALLGRIDELGEWLAARPTWAIRLQEAPSASGWRPSKPSTRRSEETPSRPSRLRTGLFGSGSAGRPGRRSVPFHARGDRTPPGRAGPCDCDVYRAPAHPAQSALSRQGFAGDWACPLSQGRARRRGKLGR